MGNRRSSKSPGKYAVGPLRRSPRIKLLRPISYAELDDDTKLVKPDVFSYGKTSDEKPSNLDPSPGSSGSNYARESDSTNIGEAVSSNVIDMEIDSDTDSFNISNYGLDEMEGAAELGPANNQGKVSNEIQNNEPAPIPPADERKKKKKRKPQKRKGRRVCPVCQKFKFTLIIWPCRHKVCKPCIVNLQEEKCPVCRGKLGSYLPPHQMGGEKWNKPNGPEALSPEERRNFITRIYERRAIISFAERNGFHSLDLSVL